MNRPRALFVAYRNHLRGTGGVQLCTAEFVAGLEAAGLELDLLEVEPNRAPTTRVLRRLNPSPYFRPLSAATLAELRARAPGARYVFLNQMNLAGALGPHDCAGTPVIGLSHGCEITDQVHLARLRATLPLTARQLRPNARLVMGQTLRDEVAARRYLAGTIAISPFDADCEAWLGTRRTCWVPRTIVPSPLDRAPLFGRFGYVGTLDHAPNLEGLDAVLGAIGTSADLSVQVVGGPERIGTWLSARHPAVSYLGPLDDAALAREAATWNGFIHPIFCLPRGCSTKLAGALAWGLPVVTTAHGRRGYKWREGGLAEAESPAGFVAAMRALIPAQADAAGAALVRQAAASGPTMPEVGARIAAFLETVDADRAGSAS